MLPAKAIPTTSSVGPAAYNAHDDVKEAVLAHVKSGTSILTRIQRVRMRSRLGRMASMEESDVDTIPSNGVWTPPPPPLGSVETECDQLIVQMEQIMDELQLAATLDLSGEYTNLEHISHRFNWILASLDTIEGMDENDNDIVRSL